MKPSKQLVFIGKSLLWSVLLYSVCMLALNWDDVTRSQQSYMPVAHTQMHLPLQPVTNAVLGNTETPQTSHTPAFIAAIKAIIMQMGKIAASTTTN